MALRSLACDSRSWRTSSYVEQASSILLSSRNRFNFFSISRAAFALVILLSFLSGLLPDIIRIRQILGCVKRKDGVRRKGYGVLDNGVKVTVMSGAYIDKTCWIGAPYMESQTTRQ